jgi:hypothetical protein
MMTAIFYLQNDRDYDRIHIISSVTVLFWIKFIVPLIRLTMKNAQKFELQNIKKGNNKDKCSSDLSLLYL